MTDIGLSPGDVVILCLLAALALATWLVCAGRDDFSEGGW